VHPRLAFTAKWVVTRLILVAALVAAVGFATYALAAPARDATLEVTQFTADRGLNGAFAECPPGSRAVGGGVLDLGGPVIRVGGSGPLDGSAVGGPQIPTEIVANTNDGDVAKRWYAGVSNDSSAETAEVKALALCSRESDATIETTPFWLDGRSTGYASATCPAGKRAVGGGVIQFSWPDNRVLASGPLDASGLMANTRDGDVAKHWYVAIRNLPLKRVQFKVFALCSADSRATIEATPSWAEAASTGDAIANCPPTKRVLGGGIIESGKLGFVRVLASGPLDTTGVAANTEDGDVADRWYGEVENRNPERIRLKVFAICEPPG
jgi:hypothetical protein